MNQLSLFWRRLFTTRRHAGSGDNNTLGRLIRQGSAYYLARDGRARPPMTIFLTVNGHCNLRCRMCDIGLQNRESMFYHNLRGESGSDFPIDRYRSLIDEVASFKPLLGVTTTEPLLYKPMFEAVDYARHRGLDTNITTNGLRVGERIDEIMDSGLYRLSVSLDGPPAIHDHMRGLAGCYDRVVDGLRQVAERKRARGLDRPHLMVNSFITDENHAHIVDFVAGLPLQDIDIVNIKLMAFFTREMVERHNAVFGDRYPATSTCFPDDFNPANLDLDAVCRQVAEVKARFGDKVAFHFEPDANMLRRYYYQPAEFMDGTKCVVPWFVAQITNDGDLAVLTRCYDLRLGNIMEQPFLDVWNGEKMRGFRRDLRKHGRFPGCARCDGVLYR
ncbi:MAG: radical SAM protein [Magnetospirillum sp. WYHS-4]